MPVGSPLVEAVGIHGSIKLGNAANTTAAVAVRSGTFTPSINIISKPRSTDDGDMNFERGMRSARIEFLPVISPGDPANTMPYSVGDRVYFDFQVSGKWKYSGSFIVETMPDNFAVDGDATTSMSGPVKPGWTKTAVPAT